MVGAKTRTSVRIEESRAGVKTPRNFAIEPTGRFILVANQSGKSVISFQINQETGEAERTSDA
jgi:6-phosphogluconolactonase